MTGEDNTGCSVVNLFTTVSSVHYFESAVRNAIARVMANTGHLEVKAVSVFWESWWLFIQIEVVYGSF